MSLSVSLYGPETTEKCECVSCGNEHTRQRSEQLWWRNITHNLNRMAEAAGIYRHTWRPEEIPITSAGELVEPLKEGLKRLLETPEEFTRFNPGNGWGSYEALVDFLKDYISACETHPEATVEVSR